MELTCADCNITYFRVKSGGKPPKRCPKCRVKHRKEYMRRWNMERQKRRDNDE